MKREQTPVWDKSELSDTPAPPAGEGGAAPVPVNTLQPRRRVALEVVAPKEGEAGAAVAATAPAP